MPSTRASRRDAATCAAAAAASPVAAVPSSPASPRSALDLPAFPSSSSSSDAGNGGVLSSASSSSPPPPPPRVSAGFSLRVATANVCVFPLGVRNKSAVMQLLIGVVSTVALFVWISRSFLPNVPLLLLLLFGPVLGVPTLLLIMPLQAGFVNILLRGEWHDHKRARLRLLLRSLDSLDCVALQELFCSAVDARYRDFVLREAKLHGFHYAVPVGRIPAFPACLLNTGTLLLSRYAITHSRTLVFRSKALFDLFIVNRGASWARVVLPTGHAVHLFTCHVAPPLAEVAERIGRAAKFMECTQHKQLEELLQFMRECMEEDRAAWETQCAADDATDESNGSPLGARRRPKTRPFSVVLAGDFNLDCGSMRYFWLLHQLHSLDVGLRDLFATERQAHQVDERRRDQFLAAHAGEGSEEAEAAEEEAVSRVSGGARARRRRTSNATRRSGAGAAAAASPWNAAPVPATAASSSSSSSSSPAVSSSARMLVAPNSWSASRGNGRERYSPQDHAPFFGSVIRSPVVEWAATFGQVLTHPHAGGDTDGGWVGPEHQVHMQHARGSSGSSPPPRSGGAQASEEFSPRHQESFLTHTSLLGSHTTHDYIFSSLRPRETRVEPFLAPHAARRLHVHAEADDADDGQQHAPSSPWSAHDDAREEAAELADLYDGSASGLRLPLRRARSDSGSLRRRHPPYTQLSDHCALLATLMLPDESEQRSRAASRS